MQRLLEGKAGVVIGASSGIGKAAAELFADEGAKVAVAARRRDRLDALVAQITDAGGEAIPITADVTRSGDHHRVVAETLAAFGRLDFALNNAGTIGSVPVVGPCRQHDRTVNPHRRRLRHPGPKK